MASIGARSVFRSLSGSARRAAAHIGSQARSSSGSPFRMATNKPLSHRTFRCAAEMSFCLESIMPFHSASSAALMISMLSISRRSCGWLPEGKDETR
ncbi:protein NUCLEAR FUSION DEFECTIVE 6, chloroplastic/mitochondrial-like isoform X1 [Cucurbita pepo subsp. pepo]|uniref:protein NUCLEAR FUSION DEFECTIVE 6, chloroplastic/mitochondrial-like isoform X1 n=1 Tax=Cucurbita pepo subsp. pepo TaxID=3664 RepID=UPI000C9D603B|nr:protein NUCLEAR FUSION DEFECTIVE 6, chloroplastic/mitochondrial-like isoform X1 [Cucurbita pepo subsp. pepo]